MKTSKTFKDYNLIKEGKKDYKTYHDSFTSAISAAIEWAESRGYEVDEDDRWNKIAMGKGRPREGDTARASLGLIKNGKPQRKSLSIQVYGMKKQYELNAYIN